MLFVFFLWRHGLKQLVFLKEIYLIMNYHKNSMHGSLKRMSLGSHLIRTSLSKLNLVHSTSFRTKKQKKKKKETAEAPCYRRLIRTRPCPTLHFGCMPRPLRLHVASTLAQVYASQSVSSTWSDKTLEPPVALCCGLVAGEKEICVATEGCSACSKVVLLWSLYVYISTVAFDALLVLGLYGPGETTSYC